MTSNIWLWYYSVTKYFIIFFSSNKPTLFNNWSCFTFCIVSLFWSVCGLRPLWCIAESAPRRGDNKKCGTISHNEESDSARSHIYNLSFLLNCETIFITFKKDDAYNKKIWLQIRAATKSAEIDFAYSIISQRKVLSAKICR